MFSKHPNGLIAAALANMGERFGFYIMMAILTLFIRRSSDCLKRLPDISIPRSMHLFIFWHWQAVSLPIRLKTSKALFLQGCINGCRLFDYCHSYSDACS